MPGLSGFSAVAFFSGKITGVCHMVRTETDVQCEISSLESSVQPLDDLTHLFAPCSMICGYILSFGSFIRMKDLLVGNPVPLVVNVTVGNIIALCGTCFMTGPTSQLNRMFHKTRKVASIFYLGSLVATLILLLLPHFLFRGLILFLLMIGQYIAITWYCLSYIPFAREFASNCCRRMVMAADDD